MTYMNLLHKLATMALSRTNRPKSDRTVKFSELLHGPASESIQLPLLPTLPEKADQIERFAATVVERLVLGALVRREQAKRIFEIGTFRGITALSMAANAPQDAVVWTLDLPPELSVDVVAEKYYSSNPTSGFRKLAQAKAARHVGIAFREYPGPCRIEQLFGDAASFDFSTYAPIDLFFVDGCHEYEAALRDTQSAWKSLRPGGLIVWHDFVWPSVQKAVRKSGIGAETTWVQGTSIAYARKA